MYDKRMEVSEDVVDWLQHKLGVSIAMLGSKRHETGSARVLMSMHLMWCRKRWIQGLMCDDVVSFEGVCLWRWFNSYFVYVCEYRCCSRNIT